MSCSIDAQVFEMHPYPTGLSLLLLEITNESAQLSRGILRSLLPQIQGSANCIQQTHNFAMLTQSSQRDLL